MCDPLHFTLNNGLCFAPRCGLCDISEENPHFRLEGECVACPAIPWLLPAMMGFGALCAGVSMVVLAKSKVTRNVLRIGVDYFQVLAMFRTAKVAWSVEVEFALKYLQFFQLYQLFPHDLFHGGGKRRHEGCKIYDIHSL